MNDVTQMIDAAGAGDQDASLQLFELVYERLRSIAAEQMAREAPGQTLQPTALVHEAWLRLGGSAQPKWQNRAHFFGAAAEAMRRILVDRARRKMTLRHGGTLERVALDDFEIEGPSPDQELLNLNEALDRFAALHPKHAQLVKLHYFIGLTFPQSADILNISEATAKRWWVFAKAWLYREITT